MLSLDIHKVKDTLHKMAKIKGNEGPLTHQDMDANFQELNLATEQLEVHLGRLDNQTNAIRALQEQLTTLQALVSSLQNDVTTAIETVQQQAVEIIEEARQAPTVTLRRVNYDPAIHGPLIDWLMTNDLIAWMENWDLNELKISQAEVNSVVQEVLKLPWDTLGANSNDARATAYEVTNAFANEWNTLITAGFSNFNTVIHRPGPDDIQTQTDSGIVYKDGKVYTKQELVRQVRIIGKIDLTGLDQQVQSIVDLAEAEYRRYNQTFTSNDRAVWTSVITQAVRIAATIVESIDTSVDLYNYTVQEDTSQ